jgi:hypothetical protein
MAYAPSRTRKPVLNPLRRRALELLADCPQEGCSEAIMLANGVDVDTMVQIILEGLATATPQRTRADRETMEVATLRMMNSLYLVPIAATDASPAPARCRKRFRGLPPPSLDVHCSSGLLKSL